MAECYIVRRGGTSDNEGGGVLLSIGLAGFIPPVEEVFSGGEIGIFGNKYIAEGVVSPDLIYEQGEGWDNTPADKISVVDLATPVTIDGFTVNSAVKIYGADNSNITYGWNFTINVPENNEKAYHLFIGVSAEGGTYDLAYVDVNGTQIGSYTTSSGALANYNIPLELPAGDNVITVKYKKDGSSSAGDDCVYIYGYGMGHYEYEWISQ